MTEIIEPDFDIAAQEARELARRATLPAMPGPDKPDVEQAARSAKWARRRMSRTASPPAVMGSVQATVPPSRARVSQAP